MLLQISFLQNLMQQAQQVAVNFLPKLVGAVLVYLIGSFIINKIINLCKSIFFKKNYDPSLQSFLLSLIRVGLMILLVLTVINMLGVETSSFAALLAGAGLAIGAALNGSLGNLAGGVMLMIFKPFKVNDLVEAQSTIGTIKEQGIFATTILTPENKTVFLPNGALSTGIITNYTTHGNLRVDITMAIALDQDVNKAKTIAINAMLGIHKVLKTPAPEANVLKVGDGMCLLAIRPYCKQEHYWDVFFETQEIVKLAWETQNIQGPTPTRIIINK